MQDHRIVRLIQEGNSDRALLALYQHFPMIRKMITANGGNTEDAEDVFQEGLIILCRKLKDPGFELTSKLSTYLFGICRFVWKDELKKKKPLTPIDPVTGVGSPDESEVASLVEQEDNARLAEKILNELGERCRELLLLFYNGGLKLKEIAAKMGYSSENTAKNQKYKCLEGARNRLKELKQTTQTI
jgi:RNA polymerase sigma factor (sigma-70 family)